MPLIFQGGLWKVFTQMQFSDKEPTLQDIKILMPNYYWV
jgi:hypothetical protein